MVKRPSSENKSATRYPPNGQGFKIVYTPGPGMSMSKSLTFPTLDISLVPGVLVDCDIRLGLDLCRFSPCVSMVYPDGHIDPSPQLDPKLMDAYSISPFPDFGPEKATYVDPATGKPISEADYLLQLSKAEGN